MATSPSKVRAAVTLVTAAAIADLQAVAEAGGTAEELRSNLFYAAPLIVADYADGTAALALDWYDEIRADAKPDTIVSSSVPLAAAARTVSSAAEKLRLG